MRWAIPASLGLHVGLLAAAWIAMQALPEESGFAEAAVSIDIVSMEDAVAEPSEVVSDSATSMVSAGVTDAAEPVETETVEPVEVAEALPVVEAAAPVPVAESIEPIETETLVSAAVMTALSTVEAPVAPPIPQVTEDAAQVVADTVAPIEPVDVTERTLPEEVIVEAAETPPPVPMPRITRKPVEAKPVETPKAAKPKTAEKPVEKKKPAKQAADLGSGGKDAADSTAIKATGGKGKASAGGGGNADAYPGQVFSRLSKAVRRPKGRYDGGEVRIMFTLDASGRVTKSALASSSGDTKVDDAAFAAVGRAKFPPIPESAGKSTWSFTFPLVIQ